MLQMSLESLSPRARALAESWWEGLGPQARAALNADEADERIELVGKADALYADEEGYAASDAELEARELYMWTHDFLQHARESSRFPFLGNPEPKIYLGSNGAHFGGWSLCRVGNAPLNASCERSCSAHGRIRAR